MNRISGMCLGAALIAASGGLASAGGAGQAQVGAERDNTIYQESTGNSNGAGDHLFAGNNLTGDARRGLIAFDVASAVPAGSTITGVSLRLHMSRSISGTDNVSLHSLTTDWGEAGSDAPGQEGGGAAAQAGDATWNMNFFGSSSWISPGGDFVSTPSATTPVGGNGYYAWSSAAMVADVQSWLDNPPLNRGWILIGDEGTNPSAKRFDTHENPDPNVRPVLTIDYIPTPGTMGVAGVLGLAMMRRRR